MLKRLIFTVLFSVLCHIMSWANADVHPSTSAQSVASESKNPSEHKEHGGGFDPVEIIMHHIADANEFHILGDVTMPLPVIIYNKSTKSWFTAMSSVFHAHHGEGTVTYNGYKMEHSRVHPEDQTQKYIDFSITKNVFGMFIGLAILFIIFFLVRKSYTSTEFKAPSGFQSFMEPLFQFVAHDIARENIGKNYLKFVPFLVCVFFFILINNLLGLIPIFPGSANISGNISFTVILAFLSFIMINLFAKKDYWTHVFFMPVFPKWLLVILTPIEILGLFIKPAALMLRLFGNITGGHIAILSITSLIFILGKLGDSIGGTVAGTTIALPLLIFLNAMELFVAFLQAYIFTLLSSIFIGIAQEEHAHSDHH